MVLEIINPALARRSCDSCQKYVYDEESGILRTWGPSKQPMVRAERNPPPCRTPNGCAKGTPEQQRSLSPINVLAYYHYLGCCKTGFPDDPLVRSNAALIAVAEKDAEFILRRIRRAEEIERHQIMASMLGARL